MSGSKLAALLEKALPNMPKLYFRGRTKLLDILCSYNDFGIGKRYVRKTYIDYPNTYWTVSKVHISKINNHFKRGKVYGTWTFLGRPDTKGERKIPGIAKREWQIHHTDADKIRKLPEEDMAILAPDLVKPLYDQRAQIFKDLKERPAPQLPKLTPIKPKSK